MTKKSAPIPRLILRGHTRSISAIHVFREPSSLSRYLLTGDELGTIRLWDINYEETLLTIPLPSEISSTPVQSIIQDPTSVDSILVQYKSGHLRKLNLTRNPNASDWESWHLSNNNQPYQNRFPESFCRIRFLSSKTWIAPASESDGTIAIYDNRINNNNKKPTILPALTTKEGQRTGMLMALSPVHQTDGQNLLAGYEDGTVAVWDIRNRQNAMTMVKASSGTILSVIGAPSGNVAIAAGGFDTIVALANTQNTLQLLGEVGLQTKGTSDLAWRNDGKLIISAGWDGIVSVWQGKRTEKALLRRIATLKWHDSSVHCLAFSDDDRLIVTGGKDRTVAVWNAQL